MENRYEQQKLRAIADCKAGRHVEAETQLAALLDVLKQFGGDIENSQVRYWYLVARNRGDTTKAMDEFMKPSVEQDPISTDPRATTKSAPGETVEKDEQLVRAINLVTRNLDFPKQEFFQGRIKATESECSEALELLREVKNRRPEDVSANAMYVFALEIAGKGVSAATELNECCERFPDSWQLDLIRRREWLWIANPLKLPWFNAQDEKIHQAINANLLSSLIILCSQGALPRAVMFLKDVAGEFDRKQLASTRMLFTTIISPVTSPQLIAVMGRIFDSPSNPFNIEDVEAPFRPPGHHRRVTFEFFVRQPSFDFVIVDSNGRVIHSRTISVSDRMAAVHKELQTRFETEPGSDTSTADLMSAIRRHQMQVNQDSVPY